MSTTRGSSFKRRQFLDTEKLPRTGFAQLLTTSAGVRNTDDNFGGAGRACSSPRGKRESERKAGLSDFRVAQDPPDAFRCRGHVDMRNTLVAQHIDDRGDDGGRRQCGASLAGALYAERIAGRPLPGKKSAKRRQIAGTRQAIVHEAAGKKLARLGFVDAVLEQRLPDTLSNAAMNLTGDDHWIDGQPHIVDRDLTNDHNLAGIRIDLDFASCHAIRIRRKAAGDPLARLQRTRQRRRQSPIGGGARDLEQADRTVGAAHREPCVGVDDVRNRRLEQMHRQQVGWKDSGVGEFVQGKFKPGLEGHESIKK